MKILFYWLQAWVPYVLCNNELKMENELIIMYIYINKYNSVIGYNS